MMTDNEPVHWLDHVMQVRKRNRIELLRELPQKYHWIAECRKSQVPVALLKIYIDSSDLFKWPEQCSCPVACDFCFEGNSNAALVNIVPFMSRILSSNFVTWWHRYVRQASPSTFQEVSSGKTLYCFNLVDKPIFFRGNPDIVLPPPPPRVVEKLGATENLQVQSINRPTVTYRCKICHQPKKGHICRGIAPPPIPQSEPAAPLIPPPAPPPLFANTNTSRSEFASIFVEESSGDARPTSRLEKIFKKQRLENCTKVEFEKIETEIDLLEQ